MSRRDSARTASDTPAVSSGPSSTSTPGFGAAGRRRFRFDPQLRVDGEPALRRTTYPSRFGLSVTPGLTIFGRHCALTMWSSDPGCVSTTICVALPAAPSRSQRTSDDQPALAGAFWPPIRPAPCRASGPDAIWALAAPLSGCVASTMRTKRVDALGVGDVERSTVVGALAISAGPALDLSRPMPVP